MGLISRTAILTASRLSNFAIHLFSPLLLVRILDVTAYGHYQEFMLYATLLTALSTLSIDSSLTYFIPRFPSRERAFVSQTTVLTLALSTITMCALFVAKPLFLKLTNFDFVAPLAAYVFFFVNLNWVDYYLIAKRQVRAVLYYSAARLVFRISVVLIVAYLTRDVMVILWALVAAEAIRVLAVGLYLVGRGVFVSDFRRSEITDQLRFAGPIGAAGVVQHAGRSVGKIFISTVLGPAALAYYVVGSYLQPVVRAFRSGIEDAVYPELVRAHNEPGGALRLWQRVNVFNCLMFFPVFVVLVYWAEAIVTAAFTSSYLPAVPVFIVYALFLLRRCFNTDVLLRMSGQTGFVLWGTLGSLGLNIILILLLGKKMGLLGPAIAFIVAEVALELYYAQRARIRLKLRIEDLADWRNIGRIALSCIVSLPILIGFGLLPGPELLWIAAGSFIYVAAVLAFSYRLGVSDVGRLVKFIVSRLRTKSDAA